MGKNPALLRRKTPLLGQNFDCRVPRRVGAAHHSANSIPAVGRGRGADQGPGKGECSESKPAPASTELQTQASCPPPLGFRAVHPNERRQIWRMLMVNCTLRLSKTLIRNLNELAVISAASLFGSSKWNQDGLTPWAVKSNQMSSFLDSLNSLRDLFLYSTKTTWSLLLLL